MLTPLDQRGATLMVVLVMVVVVGLTAGIAGSTWKTIMQREREAELLFRGEQYRRAIESYYKAAPPGSPGKLPNTLDSLLKDPRSGQTVRHLRRLYADPMTGEDFVTIRAGGGIQGLPAASQTTAGIVGVHSRSDAEPFKKAGFSKVHEDFTGVRTYSDWRFTYTPPRAPAPKPALSPKLKTPE